VWEIEAPFLYHFSGLVSPGFCYDRVPALGINIHVPFRDFW